MEKTKTILIVAIVAIVVIAAAAALMLNSGDSGEKSKVDTLFKVKIESDEYSKFTVDGDGPWGSSEGSYVKGTKLSLVAVTDVGHFGGYYAGDRLLCADASYELVIESDVSIRLVTKDVVVLTLNGDGCSLYMNGVGIGGEKAVTVGTPVTVYAVSDEGRVVTGWTGSYTSSSPVCAFVADSDAELSATTKEVSGPTSVITVTVDFPDLGSLVAYGQNVGDRYSVRLEQSEGHLLLSAEPKEGHSFSHWLLNPGDPLYDASVDIVPITEGLNILAVF